MRLAGMFKNLGLTKNWQARCPVCDRVMKLSDLGCKRNAPRQMTKRSLGWCRSCRALRWIHIEPATQNAAD